jgi:hypothetical protein
MGKIIKGFKAFNKGLKCRDFQYEVGKEYKLNGDVKICSSGFHFCENPLDVLNYYDLIDSEFAAVETDGKIDKEKGQRDTKLASDKIKITAKLDLPMFIKASFDFLWEQCSKKGKVSKKGDDVIASKTFAAQLASSGDSAQLASSGDSAQLASSGHSAQLASSGHYAQLASSGHYAQLASSGHSARLASSGHSARLASSGHSAQLASSGDSAQLASSGDSAQLASSGDSAQLASSGDSAQLELNGNTSVGANIGYQGIIKGKKGSWITLAEYDQNYKVKFVLSAQIDGEKIKEDTWYKLENEKFVAV